MSWIAEKVTIQKYAPQPFMVQVIIKYTNTVTGEERIDPTYAGDSITDAMIAEQAQKRIIVLEKRDSTIASILPGPIQLPRDHILTPEEEEAVAAAAAADAFFVILADLNRMLIQVEKGMLKPEDPALLAAQATVKSELDKHPEYAKDPRFR